MNPRKRLTDILHGNDRDRLGREWDKTTAAEEYSPLPKGSYIAHIVSGELHESKNGKPGYKLTFQVLDGKYEGRRFWHDTWLSDAALPMAKRDLGKLGIKSPDQLEQPLQVGIRCKVSLAVRRGDDGDTEYNRVRKFEVLGIDEPKPDPFTPVDDANRDPSGDTETLDDDADGDISFDIEKLEADDEQSAEGTGTEEKPIDLSNKADRRGEV